MSQKPVISLVKMKWPFIVSSTILMILELSDSILRGAAQGSLIYFPGYNTLNILTVIVYSIITLILSIFFFHYGRKVMMILKKTQTKSQQKKSSFTKITIYVISCGVCMIVWLVTLFLFIFTGAETWGEYTRQFINNASLYGISLTQILVYSPPVVEADSGDSGGKKKSDEKVTPPSNTQTPVKEV